MRAFSVPLALATVLAALPAAAAGLPGCGLTDCSEGTVGAARDAYFYAMNESGWIYGQVLVLVLHAYNDSVLATFCATREATDFDLVGAFGCADRLLP